MKKMMLFMIFAMTFFIFPFTVNAEATVVNDLTELNQVIRAGGEAKLGSDITLTGNTFMRKDFVLDLNGHTLNTSNKTIVPYANVTIKDSGQSGKITGGTNGFIIQVGGSGNEGNLILESGTIEGTVYGLNILNGSFVMNGGEVKAPGYTVCNQSSFTINNGTVSAVSDVTVISAADTNTEINGGRIVQGGTDSGVHLIGDCTVTMNGGTIEATNGGAGIMAFKNTVVTINNGTITASDPALMGNGSVSGSNEGTNAKFIIHGGTLTSVGDVAIYAPQPSGEVTVTGGTISGAKTAIEMRAGNLKISGGVFNGNKNEFNVTNYTNGSCSTGAAVALVQHATKQPINVEICGGVFNAYLPVVKANPLGYGEEDLSKVLIDIPTACGNLVFNSTGDKTVEGMELKNFIKSGAYTHSVKKYLAEGYEEKFENGYYHVYKYHNITVQDDENGEADVSKMIAIHGDKIVITATPKLNYVIESIEVRDAAGNLIPVVNNEITMPDSDIFIKINYKKLINPPTADHYQLSLIIMLISSLGLLIIGKKSLV